MAGFVDISMLGDKDIQRRFKKLPFVMQKKVLRKSLRAVAKDIKTAAGSRVPQLTGNLKRSLRLKSMKRTNWGIGVFVETGTRSDLGIDPKSKWYYPAHVELGTTGHTVQGFLRESLRLNKVSGLNKIKQDLQKMLDGAKSL